ncbi:MAG: CBS domain-containing protein [Eubacteriales bacterium]|nr:CBS domain-containing protein [Eubacteriales bacterium]NCC81344.1 CBS domain-containing protein [Clostridia bacterium]
MTHISPGGDNIYINQRQEQIIDIVKRKGPITGEKIAEHFEATRATIRSDLDFLSQVGFLGARPRVGYFFKESENMEFLMKGLVKKKVRDYHSVPACIRENTSVYDCIVQLFLEDVGTIFVVNEERYLEGVISRKDLLKATIGNTDIKSLPVSVIMTRMPKIITASMEESLVSIAKKIVDNEVDSLPVVEEKLVNGEPVLDVIARVSKTNITRAFLDFTKNL